MRAITRELHEAAQDARAAAREMAAERERFAAAILAETSAAAQMAILAIDGHVAQHSAQINDQLLAIIAQLDELYNSFLKRLGELADTEMDTEGIETFMAAAVLRACRTPEFIARVVEAVADEINNDHSLVTRHVAPAKGGQVIVATPDALDAFRRAGGNPGIVIDMREGT
jgi:hypothetical protein